MFSAVVGASHVDVVVPLEAEQKNVARLTWAAARGSAASVFPAAARFRQHWAWPTTG